MRSIFAISTFALLAACATEAPAPAPEATVASSAVPSAYKLAMDTVDQLVAAGNEQMAIDRLTQLLGNPDLTSDEMAKTLLSRAELRYGDGNDVWGALEDFDELIETYPESAEAIEAGPIRDIARGEATTLNSQVEFGGLAPTEEFEYRFRLGEHQEAADLMLDRNLQPENAYLVDLYQMGYLCDDPNLTGPSYDLTEPDGTMRLVRFCEFGK